MAENVIHEADCTQLHADNSSAKPMEAATINVVLMSEPGAGRSTLINALLNCIQFQTFDEAVSEEEGIQFAAPVHFYIIDEETYENRLISVGKLEDDTTKYVCRSYVFSLEKFRIRLIDCPSFDDYENADTVKSTLYYLSQYGTINAIAIVLKSNQARLTTQFLHCIQQILGNLDKSAIENVVFVITHCTNYKPGDVLQPLQAFLATLKSSSEINLNRNRIYCFENEGLRNLMVAKQGVTIDQNDRQRSQMSWKNVSSEFQRFLNHVSSLKPQPMDPSLFINQLRIFEEATSSILKEITENLQEKQSKLSELLLLREKFKTDMAETKPDQVRAIVDVEYVWSPMAVLICKSETCRSQVVLDDGQVKYNNKTVCCSGCHAFKYPRFFCAQIGLVYGVCKHCGCHVSDHERLNYTSREIKSPLTLTDSSKTTEIEQMIECLTESNKNLEWEKQLFEEALDTVDGYLSENAIMASGRRKNRLDEGVSTQLMDTTTPTYDDVKEMMNKVYALEGKGDIIRRVCDTRGNVSSNDTEVNPAKIQPWFSQLPIPHYN